MIEIIAPPDITPTHGLSFIDWCRVFDRHVPNVRLVMDDGVYQQYVWCAFESGGRLLVRWHEHHPAEVVRFAAEHGMLNPVTRDETEAWLRVYELVAKLPLEVLVEAEQALSGLTISDQDEPACKKWQRTDTATRDFRLVGSWAEAYKHSVDPARCTEDGDGMASPFGRIERDPVKAHHRPHLYTRDRWIAACVAQSGCVNRPDDEYLDGGETVVLDFRHGCATFKWRCITPEQAIEQARASGLLS